MKQKFKAIISVVLMIAVLSAAFINGAYAAIITKTDIIENTFLPPEYIEPVLTCEVSEDIVDFTAQTKSMVYVTNTGNINGFVRLKPNVKWVNDEGQVYYKQPVGYFYDYNEYNWSSYLDANLEAEFDYVLASYCS